MKIVILKDKDEGCVDAVIVSNVSTTQDIENAIERARANPDYQWEDLLNELPKDCTVYDKWFGGLETIYY